MDAFTREFPLRLIDELKSKPLFQNCLLKDIISKNIFPALRKNAVDFYYGGGRLFHFDGNQFSTHIKYAAVFPKALSDYLNEQQLKKICIMPDFCKDYERIKENCKKYSRGEAQGVSELYKRFSCFGKECNGNVIVLDLEVSLKSMESEKEQDRIDLLLFDKEKSELRFVEAKRFKNPELWPNEKGIRKVINQIRIYESQIKEKGKEILQSYRRYVEWAKECFDISLPTPERIHPKVILLIFEFDAPKRDGKLKEKFINDKSIKDIEYYSVGNLKSLKTLETFKNPRRIT